MKASVAEENPSRDKSSINMDILVTTDADKLVQLLKEKGEMSIKEAADILKVGMPTIESWANFLEDSGIVEITYKFTTPYLNYKSSVAGRRILPEGKDMDMYSIFTSKGKRKLQKPELKKEMTPEQLHEEVSNLIRSAYFELQRRNYERGHAIYQNARQLFSQIPQEMVELRTSLEHELVKLNSELTVHLKQTSLKLVGNIMNSVKLELGTLQKALDSGRIEEAEQSYNRIERHYNSFPEGFILEKIKLQNQVLTAYRYLVNRKRNLLSHTTEKKVNRIVALVQDMKSAISGDKFDDAEALYRQIREIYQTLPGWVINEQPKLHKDILLGFSEMLLGQESRALGVFKKKSEEIESLLSRMRNELKNNHVDAGRTYEKIKELYDSLPHGFLDMKVELINRIYESHLNLVDTLTKKLVEEFEHKQHRILRLMKRAYNHLEKGEMEFAHAAYLEIIERYNKLPPGFMELASNIRVDILNLYKELLIKSDIRFLEKATREADQLYYSILQQIISIHESIEHSEFDTMEAAYHKLIEDYGQLPLTLAQRKTHIWDEVQKIYELLHLYKITNALPDRSIEDLPGALREVKELYSKLLERCPEDIVLLRHVYSVYTEQLNRLTPEKSESERTEEEQLSEPAYGPDIEREVNESEVAIKKEETKKEKKTPGEGETEKDGSWDNMVKALVERRLARAKRYISKGLYGEANENLTEALNMEPGNEGARELLSRIKEREGKARENIKIAAKSG